MRLAGAGIEIEQLAAIEVGEVLAVRRPGEPLGLRRRRWAVREDVFDRESLAEPGWKSAWPILARAAVL
jgi:hypothetical protein